MLFRSIIKMATDNQISSKYIPDKLRELVWTSYYNNIGQVICPLCEYNLIHPGHFHCGHITSQYNGGQTELDNLKPICGSCNLSMGTHNMKSFEALLKNYVTLEEYYEANQTKFEGQFPKAFKYKVWVNNNTIQTGKCACKKCNRSVITEMYFQILNIKRKNYIENFIPVCEECKYET